MAFPTGIPVRRGWRRSATGVATPADPFNDHEPVDSSAAAIAAQGLLRLSQRHRAARRQMGEVRTGRTARARHVDRRDGPYLSRDPRHQGLLLHSIYHRPNGWDHVPAGSRDAARRVEHVGRLSPARGGALVKRHRRRRRHTSATSTAHSSSRRTPKLRGQVGGWGPATTWLQRVALVTGGTRGIGLGIARALAREGWSLALCGLRSRDEVARRRSRDADGAGGDAEYWPADIGSAATATDCSPRSSRISARCTRSSTMPAARRGCAPICSRRPRRASKRCCAPTSRGRTF